MLAVVEETNRAETARIEREAARETDPVARLRVVLMTPFHKASRAVAGSLSATVSRELRRLREDYTEELAPLTAPYIALMEGAIRQVAAIGLITPEDPHRDAQLILGMAGAIFADVSTGTATFDNDADEQYWWRFCLRALGAAPELLDRERPTTSSTRA